MGFPSVSDLADKAASILGTGPAAPGAAAAPPMVVAPATYKEMGDLSDVKGNKPGSAALNVQIRYNTKPPIRFVHFGRFHTDNYDNYYYEGSLQDDKAGALPVGNTGNHGIMFRAALEREAVLINAFIACAASIAQEMSSSTSGNGAAGMLKGIGSGSSPLGGMGAVQSLAGAASGLLGGNSGTSAAPDASALTPYQTAVQTSGAKVNVPSLPYVDMHQTGIDLHKAWLNFDKFVPSMAKPTTNSPGSGLLGNVPGTLSGLGLPSLGSAGDVIGTITSVLFSMYDIYQGMYQNVRVKLEPVIRDQSYARSLAAIRGSQQPIFDVWSVSPDQSTPPPKPDHQDQIVGFQSGSPADNYISKPLNSVNSTYDQGLNDIDSAGNSLQGVGGTWNDFWNSPPQKDGPGKDQLAAIVAAFADPTADVFGAFVSTVRNASKSTISDASFPLSIINKMLGIIVPACCGMLGNIFIQLQDPAFIKAGITQEAFDTAGRVYIRTKLVSLVKSTGILDDDSRASEHSTYGVAQGVAGGAISGAKTGVSSALGAIPGIGQALPADPFNKVQSPKLNPLTSDQASGKAIGLLDSLAGKDLDPIMNLAMGSLHDEFVKTIAQVDQDSMVMEVFLGQLPLLVALLVRNIFFPFWQLLVEKALGPLGSVANLASSPVASLMSSARDKTNDVKKSAQKLSKQIKDKGDTLAGSGLNNNAGDLAKQFLGPPDDGSGQQQAANSPSSGAGFPGSARNTSCSVTPVGTPEHDQVTQIDSGLTIQ